MVGVLPPSGAASKLGPKLNETIDVPELLKGRHRVNGMIISKLREQGFSDDLMTLAEADAEAGAMSRPVPV